MQYSLESAGLWHHTLSDQEYPKPVAIILKSKDLKDNAKLECQEKRVDNIHAWTKNNVKCKGYMGTYVLVTYSRNSRLWRQTG